MPTGDCEFCFVLRWISSLNLSHLLSTSSSK